MKKTAPNSKKKVVPSTAAKAKPKAKPKKKVVEEEVSDSDDGMPTESEVPKEKEELEGEEEGEGDSAEPEEGEGEEGGEGEEADDVDVEDEVDEEVEEAEEGEGAAAEEGEGEGAEVMEPVKESCLYNYADDNSDAEDINEVVFDDDALEQIVEVLEPDKRTTKPFLYKYERVRLLGDRAQQLTLGAKPMIKNVEGLTPKAIAELEIRENVIPLIVQRPLPNGKKERWFINELKH
ncbi:MAG: DNA-directed RNA polymerase subunit 6 [Barrevirus sp.]|uniref:DNA-directed RNA polymerase subunit 6 n=1 Tax=Barrevirus sp. TaxID=2487763 RepID=A0A3G4ZPX1_9VIRU|nr:MAG: DNA-directed RNA polymerase subunit 6 [Barrevirus sp.]